MRSTTSLLCLLLTFFVLNTGYQPVSSPQNNFSLFKGSPEALTPNDASRAIVFLDVPYGSHSDQVFDIYLPPNRHERNTKVLVLLHGGAWVRGDKDNLDSMIDDLLTHFPNHAIVNMNYTLATADNHAFPQQFLDIDLVVNHLTRLNKNYKILPEFGIIGRSSGGHLGLIYDSNYDQDHQVKFVVSIAGPTNLSDSNYNRHINIDQQIKLLVDGNTYPNDPLKSLSPYFQINASTSPVLMLHGEDDKKVPFQNATDFANKLKNNGITQVLRVYDGGHVNDWRASDWDDAYENLSSFVKNYL